MKILRQLLRAKLKETMPQLARVDRFNQQYNNINEEDPVDYSAGAIYIEVLPAQWEQLSDGRTQEADATIRLHVCREFYGSSASDEDITDPDIPLDLPAQTFNALQGAHLMDTQGRTVATTMTRINSTEDNDHDGLEIDILEFRTRITDYSAVRAKFRTMAEPKVTNSNT